VRLDLYSESEQQSRLWVSPEELAVSGSRTSVFFISDFTRVLPYGVSCNSGKFGW